MGRKSEALFETILASRTPGEIKQMQLEKVALEDRIREAVKSLKALEDVPLQYLVSSIDSIIELLDVVD